MKSANPGNVPKSKLSSKEKIELEKLPTQIEALEEQQVMLSEQLANPALYQGDPSASIALKEQALAIDAQLKVLMARWEQLLERESG